MFFSLSIINVTLQKESYGFVLDVKCYLNSEEGMYIQSRRIQDLSLSEHCDHLLSFFAHQVHAFKDL